MKSIFTFSDRNVGSGKVMQPFLININCSSKLWNFLMDRIISYRIIFFEGLFLTQSYHVAWEDLEKSIQYSYYVFPKPPPPIINANKSEQDVHTATNFFKNNKRTTTAALL